MTETQSFYGSRVMDLLPGQPSLRYPATSSECKEAARESLQERISEVLSDFIGEVIKEDENEVLNYEEKDLASLIIEVLQQDYHLGGGKR